MNRILRLLASGALLASLAACAPQAPTQGVAHHRWRGYTDLQVDSLHLGHGIHAQVLPTSYKAPQGTLYVSGRHNIDVHIEGHALYASCTDCDHVHQANAKVHLPLLKAIELEDNAQADIGRVHTQDLHINHHSTGLLTFEHGSYDLKVLKQGPTGTTKGYWIETPGLLIDARGGRIDLAGQTGRTTIQASGQAHLHLRHLRSQHIWIKARDHALVSVMPLQSLQVLAQHQAHVRYHHQLDNNASQIYTQNQATVLFQPRAH